MHGEGELFANSTAQAKVSSIVISDSYSDLGNALKWPWELH